MIRGAHSTLPAIVLVAIVACALPVARVAASGPVLSAGEGQLDLPVGQSAVMAFRVAGVQDLYGFDLEVRFDPSAVEVVDADPNTAGVQALPGDFLSPDFTVRNVVDNAAGTGRFVVTQVNPSEPKTGSGALLSLSFRGLAEGRVVPVEITGATLAARDGDAIPVTLTNGEIRVLAATTTGVRDMPSPTADLPAATADAGPTAAEPALPATDVSANTPGAEYADATPAPADLAPGATPAAAPTAGPPPRSANATAATAPAPDTAVSAAPASTDTPLPSPVPATDQPTPALVARQGSGKGGDLIVAPGAGGAQARPDAPAGPRQPAYGGLLLAAGAALAAAAVVSVLLLRSLRAPHG